MPTSPLVIYGIPDNYNGCANSVFNVTASGGGSFTWTVLGGQILSGQGSSEIYIKLNNTPGTGFCIELKESNGCGLSGVLAYKQGNIIDCDGGGGSTTTSVSPNPTSDLLTITAPAGAQKGTNKIAGIAEVVISDNTGRAVKQLKFSNAARATIDVSTLVPGVYFVRIYDGKQWISKQVVIAR